MNKNIDSSPKIGSNLKGSIEDKKYKVIPFWVGQSRKKLAILTKHSFYDFVVALSDCVNIGYVQKLDFTIGIVFLGFVSFSWDFIAQGRHIVPGIINYTIDFLLV